MALPDAADVLGPRLRVDLRAAGSSQLSRWTRPGFAHFDGVPARVAYDNLRAAVVRILVGGARTLTPRFTALASHYLLEACFCRPGEGHDKGGVEGRGQAVRQQALVPIPSGPTLAGINAGPAGADGCATRDHTGRGRADHRSALRRRMQRLFRRVPTPFAPEATTVATVTPRALVRLEGAVLLGVDALGVASTWWSGSVPAP